MKPFSLHTVLKYRKQMENKAINRLAEAERRMRIIENQFQRKNNAYHNLINELARRQSQPMDVADLIRYEEHIYYTADQLQDLKEKLDDAKELVMKARNHVLTKSKEKKVMEKLRDRQNLAWKQYLDKKEAATMDEIAVMRHNRKA